MTVLDVMAQYYNVRQNSDHKFHIYATYQFSEASFESTNATLWARQYAQIADLNTLLAHIDAEELPLKSYITRLSRAKHWDCVPSCILI